LKVVDIEAAQAGAARLNDRRIEAPIRPGLELIRFGDMADNNLKLYLQSTATFEKCVKRAKGQQLQVLAI
jgi:hypothetical protein